MLNQVIVIGNITQSPKVIYLPENKKEVEVEIEIKRGFISEKGTVEKDFIKITLNHEMATKAVDFLEEGFMIAVKGRIQCTKEEPTIKIIAERLTYLSALKEAKK